MSKIYLFVWFTLYMIIVCYFGTETSFDKLNVAKQIEFTQSVIIDSQSELKYYTNNNIDKILKCKDYQKDPKMYRAALQVRFSLVRDNEDLVSEVEYLLIEDCQEIDKEQKVILDKIKESQNILEILIRRYHS